eukprot:GHVP01044557.1.p1 GENE.GHVP01044557.1~~GHVP01044557.1.p1  ORF type:complete len:369 (+),score=74.83 GHVP01044557.1:70-1107(+)
MDENCNQPCFPENQNEESSENAESVEEVINFANEMLPNYGTVVYVKVKTLKSIPEINSIKGNCALVDSVLMFDDVNSKSCEVIKPEDNKDLPVFEKILEAIGGHMRKRLRTNNESYHDVLQKVLNQTDSDAGSIQEENSSGVLKVSWKKRVDQVESLMNNPVFSSVTWRKKRGVFDEFDLLECDGKFFVSVKNSKLYEEKVYEVGDLENLNLVKQLVIRIDKEDERKAALLGKIGKKIRSSTLPEHVCESSEASTSASDCLVSGKFQKYLPPFLPGNEVNMKADEIVKHSLLTPAKMGTVFCLVAAAAGLYYKSVLDFGQNRDLDPRRPNSQRKHSISQKEKKKK